MFELLLESLFYNNKKSDIEKTFDILVMTNYDFIKDIHLLEDKYDIKIYICVHNFNSIIEAKYSRLLIFDVPYIEKYDLILYLDTDILISGNILRIFSDLNTLPDNASSGKGTLPDNASSGKGRLEDMLYVVSECDISGDYYGKELFDFTKIDPKTPAFNSGVILFPNTRKIKILFNDIYSHIIDHNNKGKITSDNVDQRFFNYHAISKNMCNTLYLSRLSTNMPSTYNGNQVICHFAGVYSNNEHKYRKIKEFLDEIIKLKKN